MKRPSADTVHPWFSGCGDEQGPVCAFCVVCPSVRLLCGKAERRIPSSVCCAHRGKVADAQNTAVAVQAASRAQLAVFILIADGVAGARIRRGKSR